ncbi:MAG: hypothetical protein SPE65_09575, partial [Muribaculaceae bacterium]|nr:hypothetical protein [Muribaculaceae bacterium]
APHRNRQNHRRTRSRNHPNPRIDAVALSVEHSVRPVRLVRPVRPVGRHLGSRHVALEVSVSEPLGELGELGALGVAR